MKILKLCWLTETVPSNFTGRIDWSDGDVVYYKNASPHKEGGPAAIWKSGRVEWWLDGNEYTEAEYKKEMAKRSSTLGKLILKCDYFKQQIEEE